MRDPRRPKRPVTTPRYRCAHCDHQTVHLMEMVRHGIVAHGLTLADPSPGSYVVPESVARKLKGKR